MNDIHLKGLPSPQRMVFASGESPPSEWDSLARRFPPFQGVPFSKRMIFTSRDFPYPQRMGFASGESPPPKRMVFSLRGFPLHSEWDSLQWIPLVNSEWNSHQLRNPLQENGIRTKRVILSKANGIRIKRVTLSKATGIRTKGSPSPSEWDSHQEGRPLQSEWDSLLTSGLVAARDPFQGTLLRGHATQGIPFSKGLRLRI